jgi:hypothetical protein
VTAPLLSTASFHFRDTAGSSRSAIEPPVQHKYASQRPAQRDRALKCLPLPAPAFQRPARAARGTIAISGPRDRLIYWDP